MALRDKLEELVSELKDYKHNRAAQGDISNLPVSELYPKGFDDGVEFVVHELLYLLETTPEGLSEAEQLRRLINSLKQ